MKHGRITVLRGAAAVSGRRTKRLPMRGPNLIVALIASIWATTTAADFVGHGGMVRGVAISDDGSRVLTASFDYTARLWDFGSQTELGTLDGHVGPVNAVAFLPDGRHALSAGDDNTLIVWDLERGSVVHRFRGHTAKIADLAVAADGDRVATASWDGSVRLWSLSDRAETRRLVHHAAVIPSPSIPAAKRSSPATRTASSAPGRWPTES